MKTTMTYALDLIEKEKETLKKCLSNWDLENYPEARKDRDNRLQSLIMAESCIKLVQSGLNPLENGMFSSMQDIKKEDKLWCKSPNNFII